MTEKRERHKYLLHIDESVFTRLREVAKDCDTTVASVIRAAVRNYLNSLES